MSFRRCLYLVTDDLKRRSYLLRRIQTSPFFFSSEQLAVGTPESQHLPAVDLPRHIMEFVPPASAAMEFMLLGGSRNKVIATDSTARTVLFDPESCAVRTMPSLTEAKLKPVSLTVGDDLYILDRVFAGKSSRSLCFDSLIHVQGTFFEHLDDWHRHSLPPPPYVHNYEPCPNEDPAHFTAYTLVNGGSSIWISKDKLGTHAFDLVTGEWTKAGEWAMPFREQAVYLPEHNLWFGISSQDDSLLCASDLTAASPETPPVLHNFSWKDHVPPEWTCGISHLVYLGNSRFCIAKFFQIEGSESLLPKFVIFTGIEVQSCGGELHVLKHNSMQYSLPSKGFGCVL